MRVASTANLPSSVAKAVSLPLEERVFPRHGAPAYCTCRLSVQGATPRVRGATPGTFLAAVAMRSLLLLLLALVSPPGLLGATVVTSTPCATLVLPASALSQQSCAWAAVGLPLSSTVQPLFPVPCTSPTLTLPPGTLAPGNYTFTLSAGGVPVQVTAVQVAAPPVGLALTLTPPAGVAGSTAFTLSAPGWRSPSGAPLTYRFAYGFPNAATDDAPVPLARPSASPTLVTTLPAGNVSLFVFVSGTADGNTCAPPGTVTAAVAPQPAATAAAQEALIAAAVASPALGTTAATAAPYAAAQAVAFALSLIADESLTPPSVVAANSTLLSLRQAQRGVLMNASVAAAGTGALGYGAVAALVFAQNPITGADPEAFARALQISAAVQAASMNLLLTSSAAAGAAAGSGATAAAATSASRVLCYTCIIIDSGDQTAMYTPLPDGTQTGVQLLVGGRDVTTVMAAAAAATLQAPGDAVVLPLVADVPGHTCSVAMHGVGSNSALLTAPLLTPAFTGDDALWQAAFDPLPPAALAGVAAGGANTSVVSTLTSVPFDPWMNDPYVTSIITLSLAHPDGTPVPVAGLDVPITFSLPGPGYYNSLPADAVTICSWWDAVDGQYSTAGCAALPSPRPPSVNFSWACISASCPAGTPTLAWAMTGALATGCAQAVVDCSATPGASLPLNPDDLSSSASLAVCGNHTGVLRAFTGAACGLASVANADACSWNATSQAFSGAGCIYDIGVPTQCACRHLTSFVATVVPPTIAVITPSQLAALKPSDLVGSVRVMLLVVIIAFGAMHLLAAAGAAQDARLDANLLRKFCHERAGYRVAPGGAWTWLLQHSDVPDGHGASEGPEVRLTELVGIPFVRLRCAVPEELLPGSTAAALGTSSGLSRRVIGGNSVSAARISALSIGSAEFLRSMSQGGGGDDGKGRRGTTSQRLDTESQPAEADPRHLMVGTALAFAAISSRRVMQECELAEQVVATAAYFRSLPGADPTGIVFPRLLARFKVMLSSPCLRCTSGWLTHARLWRCVLLADESGDGSFHPTSSLAHALLATTEKLRSRTAVQRHASAAMRALQALVDVIMFIGSTFQSLIAACSGGIFSTKFQRSHASGSAGLLAGNMSALSLSTAIMQPSVTAAEAAALKAEAVARAAGTDSGAAAYDDGDTLLDPTDTEALRQDCPLTFSVAAISMSQPAWLTDASTGAGLPSAQASRVWATALACAAMQTLDVSWATVFPYTPGQLAVGGDPHDSSLLPETLLDQSEAWLSSALPDEKHGKEVRSAAEVQVALWLAIQEQRIARLRLSETASPAHYRLLAQRATDQAMNALLTGHRTLSLFTSSAGGRRWQGFMGVGTTLIALLTTAVWFWYSQTRTCCQEVRSLAGCSTTDLLAPCRGLVGSCSDLQERLAGVMFADAPGVPADYQCTAFPNPNSARDAFLVGLISWACSLPVSLLVAAGFSNSQSTLSTDAAWLSWSVPLMLLRGGVDWRWRTAPGKPLTGKSTWLATPAASAPWAALMLRVTQAPAAWLAARHKQQPAADHDDDVKGAKSAGDEALLAAARLDDATCAAQRTLGMALVYAIWGIMAWVIFAYGALCFKLFGQEAQVHFARSWAVGVGISQATQLRDVALITAQGVVTVALLETLWVQRPRAWFEAYVDYVSVHSTQFSRLALTPAQRLARRSKSYATHFSAVGSAARY